MIKMILRRIALLASVILFIISLITMIPRPGPTPPYLGMMVLAIYSTATALALLAIEKPTLDQRLRGPGVVCNVLAIAFPIFAWAKWVTGTLALSVIAGLIPCIGFTLLAVALLWVLEAEKVFKPTRYWAIAAGTLTFASFAIMAAGESQRYVGRDYAAGRDYADELTFLNTLANVAGLIYVITAVVLAIFLYKGLIKKPDHFANKPDQSEPDRDLRLAQNSAIKNAPAIQQTEVVRRLDLEMKKYEIVAMDGRYEYMGLLYLTPEDAIAAAKRSRGDS